MPVFEARRHLERSLPAILSGSDPPPFEVIVVDDGSTDRSGDFAREQGACVIPSGGRGIGPARARNIGARLATAEVLLFVDADVEIHGDALQKIAQVFEDPTITAAYGSYDSHPPHRGFASQYMNLRHHFVHQAPAGEAATFWTGLGAVRRRAFLDLGGFDGETFARPSVEDVELGLRIRAAGGRIVRRPDIQGTHLKEWSLVEVVRTDVFRRALPWSRLMLRHPGAFTDLNVTFSERAKAVLATALLATAVAAIPGTVPPWVPLLLLFAAGIANRRLIALFMHRNGAFFALRALLFHQVYYLYSSAAYAVCFLGHRFRRSSSR